MENIRGKKVRERTLNAAAILVCLTVVFLFGCSSIIVGITQMENESSRTAFCRILLPLECGSMEKTERPGEGKTFFLTVPALVNFQNPDQVRPNVKSLEFTSQFVVPRNKQNTCSTTASVSEKKAHEFTLVGAKPSGTG
jgi:hypothetical protein